MERKIKKKHIDYSCGFAVILLNVPMIKIHEEWVIDLNYDALARSVLVFLAQKVSPLTGNEIRFVRHYFGLTIRDFASRFGVKHPTVLKWEQKKDIAANITWGIEKDIRLFVLDKLCGSNKAFRQGYKALESCQEKQIPSQKIYPICFEFSDGLLLMAS